MSGYLIKDTTREEREQIVAESLGNIEATCDGCMRARICHSGADARCKKENLYGTGDALHVKNNVPKTGAEMCRFFLDKKKS